MSHKSYSQLFSYVIVNPNMDKKNKIIGRTDHGDKQQPFLQVFLPCGKQPIPFLKISFFVITPCQWDIPCQLTPFSAFFCRPSPILLKFGMFVGLDEKMSHTKFQVSKSNNF